ncbi:uncharacterized protein LOC133199715 [Saccostrea echinata]|uniref:uncharacterized protein LOC133199715 n=1 Tax=Saccostrea echinata TaxID=191078 RepID=UPI002A82F654|nr:uncharacterized protein LOC133199715 [Saccostrea echinata]
MEDLFHYLFVGRNARSSWRSFVKRSTVPELQQTGYRQKVSYTLVEECCQGYSGTNCETPICPTPCQNGGTCVAPNKCSCLEIVGGANCEEAVTCSHLKPCFPGTCNNNSCSCIEGFSGDSCLHLDASKYTKFTSLNMKLMMVKRSDNQLLYEFKADGFSSFQSLWVDRALYNYFEIYFEALFNPDIPYPPSYISNYGIGIVSASVNVVLNKIGRAGGGTIDISLNTTLPCPGTYNDTSPYNELLKCNISYGQFDRIIEDGDKLTILAVTEIGGFRELWNGIDVVKKELFNRKITKRSLDFMFDFTKPRHCSRHLNCTVKSMLPLKISNDASKNPFKFEVDGWNDIPSGVEKYFLEIHNLKKKAHFDTLSEENPMNPFYREERNASSLPFPELTPPGPGIYSSIVQVTDKANNSEFARQIAIYDPNSTITTTAESNFYVSSAEKLSNHSWQSRCSTVEIKWKDYFKNSYHVENHFLLSVAEFPIQRRGGDIEELKNEIVKKVKEEYDDHDGKRSVSAVNHINGITGFEIFYSYISYSNSLAENKTSNTTAIGKTTENSVPKSDEYDTDNSNKTVSTVPTTVPMLTKPACLQAPNNGNMENQWIEIENITHSSYSLYHEWKDGDSLNISVRARDIVNNTKTESRIVSFDGSQPITSEAIFTKNVGNRTYGYSSSVHIRAFDKHSGVRQIQWRLKDKNNQQQIYKEGYFQSDQIKFTDCSTTDDCYCIPMGECYKKNMEFDFDNCWMAVDKHKLFNFTFILEIEAFNQAMLTSNVTRYEFSNLTSFDGIEDGAGIKNLKRESEGDGVKFTWENIPSCYRVSDITIFVYTDCDRSKPPKEITLPIDKTEYTLGSLESGKDYCIEVISNNTGNPVLDSWIMKTSAFIPIAMIAGVSAVCNKNNFMPVIAILLGILLIFFLIWRNEHIKPETKRRVSEFIKRPATWIKAKRRTGFYSGRFEDEDIYAFAKMVFSANEGWLYTFDDIQLKGKLKSGDFADIYLAQLCKKDTVVAKILKEDKTEEDCLVLKAKISFFASEVPPHDNIITFLGSVLNHPFFGPYMLLEYCELGQMREWLIDQRNKVNDDLITDFCKMVQGIAKGMEALAIKGIVHKRLATRNILLTSRLVPKVSGFGPTPEEGENEVNKKEARGRKPIKWLAPECYESMKNCTSMSDVWAFGVVIWEIFSTGQNPYPGMDVKVVPMKVKSSYRMGVPEFCPETHGLLMESCWSAKPEDRASFTSIVNTLDSYYDARFPCDFAATDAV